MDIWPYFSENYGCNWWMISKHRNAGRGECQTNSYRKWSNKKQRFGLNRPFKTRLHVEKYQEKSTKDSVTQARSPVDIIIWSFK